MADPLVCRVEYVIREVVAMMVLWFGFSWIMAAMGVLDALHDSINNGTEWSFIFESK